MGHGDLNEDSLPIQSQSILFSQRIMLRLRYFYLGQEINDEKIESDDSDPETDNDEQMRFHTRNGDYFPDYEYFLSNQHGGL